MIHAVFQRIVFKPVGFLCREQRKAALGHVQHVLRRITAGRTAQRTQQQPAQAVAHHAVLAGHIMRDSGRRQRRRQDTGHADALRHRHRHMLPGHPRFMPLMKPLGNEPGLRIGRCGSMHRHRTAIPRKGHCLPGEEMLFQMLQRGGSVALRPGRQVLPADVKPALPQLLHQRRPTGALGEKEPSVRGIRCIHGQGHRQRSTDRRRLAEQIAQRSRQHIKAVHKDSRAVHHTAGRQSPDELLLLQGLIRKMPLDHLQIGFPDQRHIRFLGLERTAGHPGCMPGQLLRRETRPLQIGNQHGQLVRQIRRERNPPVIRQFLLGKGERLGDSHAASRGVQRRKPAVAAAFPDPARQPARGQHFDIHQAGQLKAGEQLPLRLQGILLRHQ